MSTARKACMAAVYLIASAAAASAETAIPESPVTTQLQEMAVDMKPFTMRGIGGAIGTSEWLFMEVPFWTEILPKLSGDKVTVQLTSQTALNLKGSEVFSLTSQGIVDFSEIAANYGAGDLPQLDGMDLAGVAASFEEQNAVLEAYLPVISKALDDRFGLVTAGYANSTAQVFFCNAEINGMDDLVGKKVRLTSSTMADLVSGIGASPVTMSFAEMVPAMQRGVIDCAITGTMSGNTAKLYEVGTHMYTLTVGWAPRLAFFNGDFWNGLDETQQAFLKTAIDFYFREFADPIIKKNNDEGIWCTTGDDRCTLGGQLGVTKTDGMKLVTPSEGDIARLKEVVASDVLPSFAKACGEECTANWNDTVGAVTGLTAAP